MSDTTTDHEQAVEIAMLRVEVDALKAMVEAQNKQLADLVKAWQTASGVLSVVKFIAMVGAATVAIFAYFKGVQQ